MPRAQVLPDRAGGERQDHRTTRQVVSVAAARAADPRRRCLKKEEGGRHTPFHNNYRPQFYVRTTDVTGNIMLPDGVEMVMPGDNLTINVDLIQPIALSIGLRFAIREGGRTVGAGQVTEILD